MNGYARVSPLFRDTGPNPVDAYTEYLAERVAHHLFALMEQRQAAATQAPNVLPELLTRDEAAALLRCHPITLQRRTQARDIACVKQGRSVRYRREDVLRVMREGWAS